MKIIADSGSTKTIWYLTEANATPLLYKTQGYNPQVLSSSAIQTSMEADLLPQFAKNEIKNAITEIYFYGAGCSTIEGQQMVHQALENCFPQAAIYVYSDMLAAVRAACGHQAGICAILGTGSNSCLYDGVKVIDQVPALGYLLGDEGAGVQLGKWLLQAFFYRELPSDLEADFKMQTQLTGDKFINELYSNPTPNRYLASFAPYCFEHRKHPFIKKLVTDCLDEFVHRRLLPYANVQRLPIHFVGSIAHQFQDILLGVLATHQLQVGVILQTPFPNLLTFHQ